MEHKSIRGIIVAAAYLCLLFPASRSMADPIATAQGETPGTILQMQELKAGNGAVTLKFTLVNDGSQPFAIEDLLTDKTIANPDYHSISGVYLVDTGNKKKYLPIYDADNHCVCSRDTRDIPPKSSANLWAKFPAPPDGVIKIGVVVPHFAPIDDVPLSR